MLLRQQPLAERLHTLQPPLKPDAERPLSLAAVQGQHLVGAQRAQRAPAPSQHAQHTIPSNLESDIALDSTGQAREASTPLEH